MDTKTQFFILTATKRDEYSWYTLDKDGATKKSEVPKPWSSIKKINPGGHLRGMAILTDEDNKINVFIFGLISSNKDGGRNISSNILLQASSNKLTPWQIGLIWAVLIDGAPISLNNLESADGVKPIEALKPISDAIEDAGEYGVDGIKINQEKLVKTLDGLASQAKELKIFKDQVEPGIAIDSSENRKKLFSAIIQNYQIVGTPIIAVVTIGKTVEQLSDKVAWGITTDESASGKDFKLKGDAKEEELKFIENESYILDYPNQEIEYKVKLEYWGDIKPWILEPKAPIPITENITKTVEPKESSTTVPNNKTSSPSLVRLLIFFIVALILTIWILSFLLFKATR